MSTSSSSSDPHRSGGHKRPAAATDAAAEVAAAESDPPAADTNILTPGDAPHAKRSKHDHATADASSGTAAGEAAASAAATVGEQATAPAPTPIAASVPCAGLLSVPVDVMLLLADSFLLDSDAVRCARSCHSTFLALRRYRLKSAVTFDEAIRFADDSSAAWQAAVEATEAKTAAASPLRQPAAASFPPPLRSPWRTGRLQRVKVWANQDGAAQLDWLPRSVTELQAKQEKAKDDEDEEDAAPLHLD